MRAPSLYTRFRGAEASSAGVRLRAGGAETAGRSISRTGKPSAIHEASPPSSGWTRVRPFRLSWSATRALVASLGQEQ
jgi:hypothetical protein